ncbi:MAG: hypothetical protein H6968_11670 [Chromatiaceae bacterium]|nr:hypothetical protein [Chromatiaceae bacterium]
MSNQSVDSAQKERRRDPDLVAAEVAMKRAARKARDRARQTGTGVVVWKEGQIVEERQDSSAKS